jgi:hypothetical protein
MLAGLTFDFVGHDSNPYLTLARPLSSRPACAARPNQPQGLSYGCRRFPKVMEATARFMRCDSEPTHVVPLDAF